MARKIIELPQFPKLPTSLPFEDGITHAVDRLLDLAEKEPLHKGINRLVESIPIVPERQYPTPLGTYKTPEFYIPKITPARFDDRQRQALKAAVMTDLASLVEMIPGLGAAAAPISDAISDTAYAKIQDTLTPDESKFFRSFDKVDPISTIAMIRTMVRIQKER